MGSFANSLHVKCNDAKDVIAAIQSAMHAAGYETTDEQPDEDALCGMPSAIRALYVTEAYNGWAGLLDSDLVNSFSLASDLSRRLETYTIQFFVHDSDSWHYHLCRYGSAVDEFSSSDELSGGYGLDEMPPEIIPFLSGDGPTPEQQGPGQGMRELLQQLESDTPEDIRDIQQRILQGTATQEDMTQHGEWIRTQPMQEIKQCMDDMLQRVEDDMPADIRDIQQRIQQDTATQEERKQFAEWLQSIILQIQFREIANDIQQAMPEMMRPSDEPSVPKPELTTHLEKLRPILSPDATDRRVLEVLGMQAVFAEEIFGEFTKLLGIQPDFAYLGYDYLNEWSHAELIEADIKVVAHLKFKTDTISN